MIDDYTKPARVGRERTCAQCGSVYRSPRSTSLYCSALCRKKANRGTAPAGSPKAAPPRWGPITRALAKTGYVGRIGPVSSRAEGPAVFGLLVPFERALEELSHQFNRLGFGYVAREEFADALKRDGIRAYNTRSPEDEERNRYLSRQRQRIERAS